jgi:hypothetical protein
MATELPDRIGFEKLFERELLLVQRRRSDDTPADKNLAALAISGGGIRSATFGLGILEGLKSFGLLKKLDYLSTVSGGGYIGAWLSANCRRAAERRAAPQKAPEKAADKEEYVEASKDWLGEDAKWGKSVAHLRRYSNYLSPQVGFFSADTWSMATIWLRNTILVQLTVISAIAVLLLLPRLFFEGFVRWPEAGPLRWISVLVFLIAVAGIAGNECRLNGGGAWLLHSDYWRPALKRSGLCVLLACDIYLFRDFKPFENEPVDWIAAAPIALLLVFAGFFFLPVGVKLMSKAPWLRANPPKEINYTQAWVQYWVVVPMMIAGFLCSAVLWGQSDQMRVSLKLDGAAGTFSEFFMTAWYYWPLPLSVVVGSLWLVSYWSLRFQRDAEGNRCTNILWIWAPFPAVFILYTLLCAIILQFHRWSDVGEYPNNEGAWHAFVWGPPLVLLAFSVSIVILIGMMGRQSTEAIREWWSRLGAWLSIYGVAWMIVTLAAVYGPLSAAMLLDSEIWNWAAIGGWLATTLAGLLAGKSGSTAGKPKNAKAETTATEKVLNVIAVVGPFVFIAGLLIGIATCLHIVLFLNSPGEDYENFTDLNHFYWPMLDATERWVVLIVLVITAGCLSLLASRVDINEFSLNAFYRSRLSRCYLGATHFLVGERKPQAFTEFDENDDLPLSDLMIPEAQSHAPPGPLHIVNCALNLGGSSDLAMHTRHSASFAMSPIATGSGYMPRYQGAQEAHAITHGMLGYRLTSSYGGPDGQPTLGQAISVSGAAASPNMGYHTSPVVAFLLTVFNVRLGWWFPNPAEKVTDPSPRFSLRFLVMELFGGANEKSNFLMISDGGHFENLAAYELIRRKARVIIISDAECDRELHFEGVGSLIRMCEVDFGHRITLDLSAIRLNDNEYSHRRWAVGSIDYVDEHNRDVVLSTGVLIYLKASMTGDEDSAIQQYKSAHLDFPHESTGDQFYGEDQFESYRRLGKEIAKEVFSKIGAVQCNEDFARKAHALLKDFGPGTYGKPEEKPVAAGAGLIEGKSWNTPNVN